jgi:hypothetical protein
MDDDENTISELIGYEDSLVNQFFIMEKLVEASKQERELILKGSIDLLMKNTEEKEAILDKFSLIEENSRMFLQKIFLLYNIQSEQINSKDILPLD